jgi:MoaA/NifB/PqqE/SkfB family radical SAM enzyme
MEVSFDTNLGLPLSGEPANAVVASGLDSMTITLDGASQEMYSQYRRGSDFKRGVGYNRLLIETKKRLGAANPP